MKPRVLVVDDSLTVRMDITDGLNAADFEAVACDTIESARKALEAAPVTLIILDVLLPDGDGVDFLEELKDNAATAPIPVILLSSESEVTPRLKGLSRGASEYIGKPYDLHALLERVRSLAMPKSNERATILVIDDSTTFRRMLIDALERAGYATLEGSSGEEGLHLARVHEPNALVVDGMLPGISGAEVIGQLKADLRLRGIPCLLLTAAGDADAQVASLRAGADAFVHKGDDLEMVEARLAALLRAASSPEPSSWSNAQHQRRILAVDDSPTFLNELGAQLRGEGYDVVLAKSGEEALDLLAAQSVDAILLDMLMPGLSGQETCRRIKRSPRWRNIPVLILTALDDKAATIAGINAGADDYIPKSADFSLVRARLVAQLRRRGFEDENRAIREKIVRKEAEGRYAAALEEANRELESFSYSVAHDLRTPLRSIDGFSRALLDDYGPQLDERGQRYLTFIRQSAQHMSQLIDDLLALSRVTRAELHRDEVDLAALATSSLNRLQNSDPNRVVNVRIDAQMRAMGDRRLLGIVFDNLLSNAWKFTSKCPNACIEVGVDRSTEPCTFFVRDNGAGFDMSFSNKLFGVFQRLHASHEYEGTGVGLATVNRIVRRHGGRVWAEGVINEGATFYFQLG